MFTDDQTADTLNRLVRDLGYAAIEVSYLEAHPELRALLESTFSVGTFVRESVWANTQAPTGWSQRLRVQVFKRRDEKRSSTLPAELEPDLLSLLRSGVPVVLERPAVDEIPAHILYDFDLGPSGADVISRQVLRVKDMLLVRLQEVRTSPSSSPVSVIVGAPATTSGSQAPPEAPPWSGSASASAP